MGCRLRGDVGRERAPMLGGTAPCGQSEVGDAHVTCCVHAGRRWVRSASKDPGGTKGMAEEGGNAVRHASDIGYIYTGTLGEFSPGTKIVHP